MVDDGGESAGTDGSQEGGAAKATAGLDRRIKRLSLAGILGSAAVILVVGAVVGLGAGYKIEQTRVKNDVKAAEARASKKTAAQTQNANVQLRGKVVATTANTVNLTVTTQFLTNQATIMVKATPGTPTDIAAGARVVWRAKKGQPTQADAVIVLPANAKMGWSVVNASANSMTLKGGTTNVTVSTTGATVEKVTSAKPTDLAAGTKLVTQARQTNQTLTAIEVIVLPSTSTFVP